MPRSATIEARTLFDDEGRPATPNVVQQWGLDAVFSKALNELFVFGGFGSGKTQLLAWGMWRGMQHAYQAWNGKRLSRARFALVSSTGSQLRTVTVPAFVAAFNAATGHDGPFWSTIKSRRNPLVLSYNHDDKEFELPWCTLRLATGHNGAQSLEGGKFVGIGSDESPLYLPETLARIRARQRQTGYPFRFILYAATPQPGRALAEIKTRYQNCVPYETYTDTDPMTGETYGRARIMMPTMLNLANLPPGYVQQLRSGASPQMIQAILRGELVIMEGRVYPTYDSGSTMAYQWRDDLPVSLVYDPGFHRPYVGALQEFEPGRWVAFDEVAVADTTRDSLADMVCKRPWATPALREVIQDPAAESAQTSGESDRANFQAALRGYGIRPTFRHATHTEDKIKTYRYERLRAWLQDGNSDRGLFVANHLVGRDYGRGNDGYPIAGIHMALEEQVLLKGSDDADRSRDQDHLSHPVDALGYGAVLKNPVLRADRTDWRQSRKAGKPKRSSRPATTKVRRGRVASPARAVDRDM